MLGNGLTPQSGGAVGNRPAIQWLHAAVRRLLSLSVFYKVLFANSAIVVVGALGGTAITLRVASDPHAGSMAAPLIVSFSVIGLVLSASINVIVLRAALDPLVRLQYVVERVRQGDLTARAHPSPLADAGIARLALTLNQILEDVQRYEVQVHALSADIIRAQEDERQRISRELHDDTGQVLTLLLIRLKLLEEQPGAEALSAQIAELRALVAGAIEQVRRLALNLRPPTLDQLGLVPALRSLVATYGESTHVPVRLRLPDEPVHLTPSHTIAVYRVVQEALTNVAKHASASEVEVIAQIRARRLDMTIHDDGRGFTPDTLSGHRARSGPGIGLFGMEERARLAGGSLTIASSPGRGTTVHLSVPLEPLQVDRTAESTGDSDREPADAHAAH